MLFLMMLFLAFNNELDALVQRRKPPPFMFMENQCLCGLNLCEPGKIL